MRGTVGKEGKEDIIVISSLVKQIVNCKGKTTGQHSRHLDRGKRGITKQIYIYYS